MSNDQRAPAAMRAVDADAVVPASLSVGIVTWRPDLALLARTVDSLTDAITEAERALLLSAVKVTIIDNGSARQTATAIRHSVGPRLSHTAVDVGYEHGHGNIGYGAGHNLALFASRSDYHLVLNPDVILDRGAIVEAVRFMQARPDVALLSPAVKTPEGRDEHLAKRSPALLDLALRGGAPAALRERHRRRLDRYVDRDNAGHVVDDLEVASGCFMFLRCKVAQEVGGFDRSFFLYFEDFDLAMRLRPHGRIAYVPGVRIVHYGGGAARKGVRHVAQFARSAVRYFNKHGWRIA